MSFVANLIAILLIAITIAIVPDINISSILIFVVIVGWIIYRDRKKFTRDSILLMRKTQRGKQFVINLGLRFSRFWKALGSIGVIVGVAAAIWFYLVIIFSLIDGIFSPQALPTGGIVLPTLSTTASIVPGVVLVPFWYWIISIGLLLVVHEGFHAIMAAAQKIKLKYFGVGLLAIIPLAFVEPDEKKFVKEKKWKQLRVLSAGSFANFLLAVLVVIIGSLFVSATLIPVGVTFDNFIVEVVEIGNISFIDGKGIQDVNDIKEIVNSSEGFLSGEMNDGTKFFVNKDIIESNEEALNLGIVPVFSDLPAVNAGLSGTIISINDKDVKSRQELTEALTEAGPGKEITIKTVAEGEVKEFTLTTANRPEAEFDIDSRIPLMVKFERVIPGSIDTFQNSRCVLTPFAIDCFSSLFGADKNTRISYQSQIFIWNHIAENYSDLRERAEEKVSFLESRLDNLPETGYIGISNPRQDIEYADGLENYAGAISWINGLIVWIVILNLGIGLINLAPIFITDGARIWDIIFQRIFPKRHRKITLVVSLITVFLIIATILLPVLRSFL